MNNPLKTISPILTLRIKYDGALAGVAELVGA